MKDRPVRSDDRDGQGMGPLAVGVAITAVVLYIVMFFRGELVAGIRRLDLLLVLDPIPMIAQWLGEPGQAGLSDRLLVLIPAAMIVAFATVVGWLLIALVAADRKIDRLEMVVFSAGVGLSAVSLATLLLGLAGCLNRWCIVIPAVAVLVAAAIKFQRRQKRATVGRRDKHYDESSAGRAAVLSARWLWLALPACLYLVLGGMLPPIEFDVREYHLQAPKEFYQQGGIDFLPHNAYAQMPLGAEMQALLAMVLVDDWWLGALVGKTVIALIALLTALAVYCLGMRVGGRTVGVVGAVVYLTLPWTARVSMLGLIDGVVGLYCLLSAYAILLVCPRLHGKASESSTPSGWGPVLLAGFLAGSAVACKYPALLFVLLPMLAAVVCFAPRNDARPWTGPTLFLVAALVACGPWFGKNLVLTGNPTYPLFNGTLGGDLSRTDHDRRWQAAHRPKAHDGQTGLAAYHPYEFARSAASVVLKSRWHGPILIPLMVVALFASWRRLRVVRWMFLYFMLFLAMWWSMTHRIDRFWVPLVPLAAVVAGIGATCSGRTIWQRIVPILLVLSVFYGFVVATTGVLEGPSSSKFFVALDVLRRDPDRVSSYHLDLNQNRSDVGTVLLVGGAQPFDLEMDRVLYNTTFDPSQLLKLQSSAAGFQTELHRNNVSHILVNWGEIDRYRSPGNYGFAASVEPELFTAWVADQILTPLDEPDTKGRHWRYQVR